MQPFDINKLPTKEDKKQSLVDLFVHLPMLQKHIRWVLKGDEVDLYKKERLKDHPDPRFYAKKIDLFHFCPDRLNLEDLIYFKATHQTPETWNDHISRTVEDLISSKQSLKRAEQSKLHLLGEANAAKDSKIIQVGSPDDTKDTQVIAPAGDEKTSSTRITFENPPQKSHDPSQPARVVTHIPIDQEKYLTEEITNDIFQVYRQLNPPAQFNYDQLSRESDQIASRLLDVISPDTEQLRQHLLKNAKYIDIIHDSSAILTLSILFAGALNYSARAVFMDLSLASILMDLSLCEFSKEERDKYLLNPEECSTEFIKKYKSHPMNSYIMCNNNLKNFTEVIGQLILGHHELHNGKGFPRGVRSGHLPPLVRIHSLAVDCFEELKRAKLRGETSIDLDSVLVKLKQVDEEAHSRRHATGICDEVIKFIKSDSPITVLP